MNFTLQLFIVFLAVKDQRTSHRSSDLSVELQLSSAGSVGVDGEISRFVDDAAQRLQTWTVTLHLRGRKYSHIMFQN